MTSPLNDSSSIYLNDTISPRKPVRNVEDTAEKDIDTQETDIFLIDSDEDDLKSCGNSPFLDKTMPPRRSTSISPRKPISSGKKRSSGSTPSKSPLKISSDESPDFDSTRDIFDTSQESEGSVRFVDSPKKKISPKKSSMRAQKAQPTIDKFLMQKSSSNTSRRRRVQQSKMDLFVKWKDPNREKQSDDARREFFAGPSKRKDAHKSSDDEPQVIGCSSPPKKRSSHEDMRNLEKKSPTARSAAKQSPAKKRSSQEDMSKLEKKSSAVLPSAPKQSPAKKKSSQTTLAIMTESERQMKERRRIMKGLLDESFEKSHRNADLDRVKKEQAGKLKEGMVVRQKADRERMHAVDCACCKDYYDALDLSPESKKKRIQQVGRHRYIEQPKPKTPEHYWEVGFPSESEQKRRGYIRVKSPKKKLAAKKLFTSP